MRCVRVPLPVIALLALAATGCGQSNNSASPAAQASTPAASVPAPAQMERVTPAAARAIVTRLWTRREVALGSLSAPTLSTIEVRAAAAEDRAYVSGVRCGCQPQKDPHPLLAVLPDIPRAAQVGTFLAQVRTTNASAGDHPWYVLAVTRTAGGWKIAYVTFGGYKAAPPLHGLGVTAGATAPVSARDEARMVHIAQREAWWGNTHAHRTSHTSYGATVRARGVVRPAADGVFGLTLPRGRVLSCFTLHELDTYSLRGGLAQDDSRRQWGWQLAPGGYRTITADTAAPECAAGTGVGQTVPHLWLQYTPQLVGVTGTPIA
jgi:hypothetical protein